MSCPPEKARMDASPPIEAARTLSAVGPAVERVDETASRGNWPVPLVVYRRRFVTIASALTRDIAERSGFAESACSRYPHTVMLRNLEVDGCVAARCSQVLNGIA